MENTKIKKQLLATPMNKLGLGGAFDSWFWGKHMQQKDVLSLKEFMNLNSLKASTEKFICRRIESDQPSSCGFIRRSKSWEKLKEFLLKSGFTHDDWAMLLPEVDSSAGVALDIKLLNKKILLSLPYLKVTDVKAVCGPARAIQHFFDSKGGPMMIVVKDMLSLTGEMIGSILPSGCERRKLEKTFQGVQAQFKLYGLTERDGPFMKLKFPFTHSREYHVDDLVNNKNFTRKDADAAVDIGIKAGWIKVSS